ncbi:HK97 gp10 family phage protein [Fructilactobacillus frigidiflavus]|uniref:HK97 gp10 family phage protein n=1 Tax=Fructilactobacillus frigidiflavus TaxID=3242688 RepID=UPI0037573B5B
MTVNIAGLNELEVGLKKRMNLAAVAQVVKRNGAQMQDSAQRNAPVRTGFLRRNIHLNYFDGGMTAKVTSDASYAVNRYAAA